jgi:hypothetical protein
VAERCRILRQRMLVDVEDDLRDLIVKTWRQKVKFIKEDEHMS